METLIIKVAKKEDVAFLKKLLDKLKFVTEVQTEGFSQGERTLSKIKKDLPVQWGKNKPSIGDFAGIWENRNISLKELREKAWTRS